MNYISSFLSYPSIYSITISLIEILLLLHYSINTIKIVIIILINTTIPIYVTKSDKPKTSRMTQCDPIEITRLEIIRPSPSNAPPRLPTSVSHTFNFAFMLPSFPSHCPLISNMVFNGKNIFVCY